MTNLQAIQDQWLQDLIYQVEQLERLVKFADSNQYRTLCDEISELHKEVKERWKELLGE